MYHELVQRNYCIEFVASLSAALKQQQTHLQFRPRTDAAVGQILPALTLPRAFCCAHEGHCNDLCSFEYHGGLLLARAAIGSRYDSECFAAAELASDTIDIVFHLNATILHHEIAFTEILTFLVY